MCYIVLLSTTSERDLSLTSSDLVRFSRKLPEIADAAQLLYPHRWDIGSKTGCGCTFRHAMDASLGFGEPVDWYPEDSEKLEATLAIIRVVRQLLEEGAKVDCIDVWNHQESFPAAGAELTVDLTVVADREFRFFENHHFRFKLSR